MVEHTAHLKIQAIVVHMDTIAKILPTEDKQISKEQKYGVTKYLHGYIYLLITPR